MKRLIYLLLMFIIFPLYLSAQDADFGDAPDKEKWWGGTALFPTLKSSTGPMHTKADQSTFWIGENSGSMEPDANVVNLDDDDGRPFIFIWLIGIPAPAEITVPISTSASHNPNEDIYVNVAIDVDNDLDFNDNPDLNWVVRNQIIRSPADTTLGYNFGPFGFGNDLLLLPVWVRITVTSEEVSSPWNGMGTMAGWTNGETEDWYFGSKGTRGHNGRKGNNPPPDSIPPDSLPPGPPQPNPDPEKCIKLHHPHTVYVKCEQEKCIYVGVEDCGEEEVTDISLSFEFLKGTPLGQAPHVVGNPVKVGKTTWFEVCVTGWDCEEEEMRYARYKIKVSYDPDGLYVIKEFDMDFGNDEFPFQLDEGDNFVSHLNVDPLDSTDFSPWYVAHGESMTKRLVVWAGEYPGGGNWLANGQPQLLVNAKPEWCSFAESDRSLDGNSATYTVSGSPTSLDNGMDYIDLEVSSDDPSDNFAPWNLRIPIYIFNNNNAPQLTAQLDPEFFINVADNEMVAGSITSNDADKTLQKIDTMFFDWYLWDTDSSKFHDDGIYEFSSTGNSAEFQWEPGNNEIGNYELVMQTWDYYQDMDSSKADVYVFNMAPDFKSNIQVGFVPMQVEFEDMSIVENTEITDWEWNFDDGNYSNEQNPTHTYNNATTYTVHLIIDNGTHEIEKTNFFYIIAKELDFYADTTQGYVPFDVQFNNQATSELPTSYTSNTMLDAKFEWLWDFGDGLTSSEHSPIHTYTTPGMYEVSLIGKIYYFDYSISDTIPIDSVISEEIIKSDYITVNGDLVANFEVDTTEGYLPFTVNFTDMSTGDPEDWLWTFGDGQESDIQHPVHIYNDAGWYSVSLTVKKGEVVNTKTVSNLIYVKESLSADFTAEPVQGVVPLEVHFVDASIGEPAPIHWTWYFGDGQNITGDEANHIYTSPGTYDVKLVIDNGIEKDSITKEGYITVSEQGGDSLMADFTAVPRTGQNPLEVQFTDASTGNVTNWLWSFGDSTETSVETDPVHTYDNSGTYTVVLTVGDGENEDTETKEDYIIVGGIGVDDLLINSFELYQNYPNPVTNSTTIKYELESSTKVTIELFNSIGESVNVLVDKIIHSKGTHQVIWNSTDLSGKLLPSGTYFIKLSIVEGDFKFSKTKELIIVR